MNSIENNSPIYLQIAEKIATKIFGGKLNPGEWLPTVREIALSEKANPNTVQKALNELERDGLILSQSTNGKYVTNDIELIMRKREEYAAGLTRAYEKKMQDAGAEVTIPKIMWPTEIECLEEKKEKRRWFF